MATNMVPIPMPLEGQELSCRLHGDGGRVWEGQVVVLEGDQLRCDFGWATPSSEWGFWHSVEISGEGWSVREPLTAAIFVPPESHATIDLAGIFLTKA